MIVNTAIVYVLQGEVPIAGCNGMYDMPSGIAQHAGFFVMSVLLYSYEYRTPHIHAIHHALLAAWAVIVPFSLAFFNFNSPAQLMVAYLVGSLGAFAYHIAIVFPIIVPKFPIILQWRIIKWCGYEDNMCCDAFRYTDNDDDYSSTSSAVVGYAYIPASTKRKK